MSTEARIRFTRQELLEMYRAIDLISQEDDHADVNMDRDAVRAKQSALGKVLRLLKRTKP